MCSAPFAGRGGGRSVLALAATLALAPSAHAQETVEVEAIIVHIDGIDLFVDVPAEHAEVGLVLHLYRPIEVVHPLTHRRLRDRFYIGDIEITAPGEVLSAARPRGTMRRAVAVGDEAEAEIVVAPAVADAVPDATDPEADADTPVPADDDEAEAPFCPPVTTTTAELAPEDRAAIELFESTLGRPPERRALAIRRFLHDHPDTPHRDALEADAAAMEHYAEVTGSGNPELRARTMREAFIGFAIEHATAGEARELALGLRWTTPVRRVRLHVRAAGTEAYASHDFVAAGPFHLRAVIPADEVVAGGIEYFVEATDVEGLSVEVLGTAAQPRRVSVDAPAGPGAIPSRSIRISGEFVGFDTFAASPNRDWYFLGEVDVLYRTLTEWLYGVRLGFAAFGGRARNVDELRDDTALAPYAAGFTYGYLELEGHFVEYLGIAGRLELGLGVPGDPDVQSDGVAFGGQLRIRIGEEFGTHLLLAGELNTSVGQRAYIGLAWAIAPEWPSRVEVHVTDQPVASGLGVRIVVEQGYRLANVVSVAVRLSYQGRRIDHTGIGAGLALTFDW